MNDFKIIDFHMHPFIDKKDNLCMYKEVIDMTCDTTYRDLKNAGIEKFCGSVIKKNAFDFSVLRACNRDALKLREMYGGDYIPGFQISPNFIEESIQEIEYAHNCNVKLIGELVPYMHDWGDYSCEEFSYLLEHLEKYDMVVNLHTLELEQMEVMAKNHPNIRFVFAHPGEYERVRKHIDVMKKYDNVSLDISGTGIIRYGVIKELVSKVGAERILFGTDYPIGNLQVYINGVLGEKISDREKELIFSVNAENMLNL